jgi:NAD(P)-dependent dehydrogenase (short-subunit alcohol dehydrogenase family)
MTASAERVALVTGSTDGIGRQSAYVLAFNGLRVIVHGRGESKAARAADEVRAMLVAQGAGDKVGLVEHVAFDLGSFDAVRKGAAAIAARHGTLDILVNNAGIFANERSQSHDGHELTLAVNYLGPFLLTALLLPLLERAGAAAAEAGEPRAGRIVNVSSVAHLRGQLRLDDLAFAEDYSGYAAYARSKLANVMHAVSLSERLDPARVTANSLHPGVVATKLLRQGFGPVRADTVEDGVATPVYLAVSPAVEGVSGRYFVDCAPAEPARAVADAAQREALWQLSARLCGL